MATRLKIYYPENQIVRNLTTTGKKWMLSDGTEYVGLYHKYSTGEVFTQPAWNATESQPLIPYKQSYSIAENLIYKNITKTDVSNFTAPVYYFPVLSETDYSNGTVTRYFVQRNNLTNSLLTIIEVSKDQYSTLSKTGSGINNNLYRGISIPWKLTGPKNDVFDQNQTRVTPGVEDTNRRVVEINDLKMPGLLKYLSDFTELSVYSLATPTNIKQKFL